MYILSLWLRVFRFPSFFVHLSLFVWIANTFAACGNLKSLFPSWWSAIRVCFCSVEATKSWINLKLKPNFVHRRKPLLWQSVLPLSYATCPVLRRRLTYWRNPASMRDGQDLWRRTVWIHVGVRARTAALAWIIINFIGLNFF